MENKKIENLRIEVLVNSRGPHEQVRIREPFSGLQRLGIDCRMFRYPFILEKSVRNNSLVIWQRPRPKSWNEQIFIIQSIRKRGSILLTEWDDHPNLFPKQIQSALEEISMAPLKLCHGLHTSSEVLSDALNDINPISYILPNAIWRIPNINLKKHKEKKIRIFIGNQNRAWEHNSLIQPLLDWSEEENDIKFVVIGDSKMAKALPFKKVENYSLLNYLEYRKVMRTCHIALLPLKNNLPNNCKTEIKWMEAAAESVAVIAGPGLYKEIINGNKNGIYCESINDIVPKARQLKKDLFSRMNILSNAHNKVLKDHNLRNILPERVQLYKEIWEKRFSLDEILLKRFPEISE